MQLSGFGTFMLIVGIVGLIGFVVVAGSVP
mgnify:FL=1|jgi:hypothetical protein